MSIKSKPNLSKRLILSAVGMVLMYLPVQQSFAQLEEILVTARRFEESITDAPLAVAVMTNEFLKDSRIDSIQDILELSPGAGWGQFAKAQPGLSLRGVSGGTFGNASLESAVQVVYDGIPATKAFMMTLPVYDLARVEIMRGPQGTTFGRNATIGLMHFISARPSQETSGAIEGSVGDLGLFGVNGHYNTALSDTLSGRIAFNYQTVDGAHDDAISGEPLEGSENLSLRASLLYEPSDTFSAYLKAEISQDEDLAQVRRGREGADAGAWLNPGGFGGYSDTNDFWSAQQDNSREWPLTRDMTFVTAELVWNMGDLAVTSLSGYQSGKHHSIQDAFGTPFALRDQIVKNDAEILSTEIRIDNYASGNRLRWLAGANFLKDSELRVEHNIGFPERGACGGRGPAKQCFEWQLIQSGDADNQSFGLFGEVVFDITEALTLAVGGRYSDESRDLFWDVNGWGDRGGIASLGLGNGARDCDANTRVDPSRSQQSPSPAPAVLCGSATNPMGFVSDASNSWDNFSGKVSLNLAVNDNLNAYVLYSEGFKAGGFQHDARNLEAFNNFLDEETMTNYEIGLKGSYDRAIFAVTAFKMEQSDRHAGNQVALGSGNANLLINGVGVESIGYEFEGTFAVTDNFTVGGNVGFYDVTNAEGAAVGAVFNTLTGTLAGGEDISGTRIGPHRTAALNATYVFELSGGSSVRLRADWRHRSAGWTGNPSQRDGLNLAGDAPMNRVEALDKLGAQISWTSADENLSVALWGRNLDNKAQPISPGPGIGYIFNLGQAGPEGERERSRPVGHTGRKSIGATVSYRFGG